MPLLASFAICASLLLAFIFLGKFFSFSDSRRSDRHLHKIGTLRFGGIAIILSFIAVLVFDNHLVIGQSLLAVILASIAILVFGTFDDVRQLSWKVQLFFQVFIVVLVYVAGVKLSYVTNPFGGIFLLENFFWQGIGLIFSVAWIVFLMNAMNWIDGVDGASSGMTLIGAVTVFFLSLRPEVNQPPVAIICAAFVGAILAFLFLNFYPAKILAGTSGSMFMGFILGVVAIFAGAKIATTLLVLVVPIIDAIWVIGRRMKAGDSIFKPDKRHLHFRLLEIGWSVKKICFFCYLITALVALVALNTRAIGKTLTLLIIIGMMFAVYAYISRKAEDNNENQDNV